MNGSFFLFLFKGISQPPLPWFVSKLVISLMFNPLIENFSLIWTLGASFWKFQYIPWVLQIKSFGIVATILPLIYIRKIVQKILNFLLRQSPLPPLLLCLCQHWKWKQVFQRLNLILWSTPIDCSQFDWKNSKYIYLALNKSSLLTKPYVLIFHYHVRRSVIVVTNLYSTIKSCPIETNMYLYLQINK